MYDIGVEGHHEFVANGVVVHNCYKESSNPVDGWLTQKSIDLQKSVIPKRMWEVEFELQEPSFEGRAIDTEAVDRCFDPALGECSGELPWSEEPGNGHYVTAVDWAKKRDKTIIATFNTKDTPWRCVAWQQIYRAPWPIMVAKAVDQWRIYGGKFIHDATGVGDVVDDIIREMITSREQDLLSGYVFSSGRDRTALFAEYASAIENDDIRYPRIEYAYNEHRYAKIDDLYGNGHPPDSIIAGSLAWRTRTRQSVVVMPVGGSRQESPWF